MRPINNSGVQGSTTTSYVQQVGYWPHGAVYYWQYGNNVWPVENYTQTLQPAINYATVANSSSQFLLYLQNVYNTDSTVNSIVEQYGPAVPAASLTNVNEFLTYDHIKRLTNISDLLGRRRRQQL